MWEYYIILDHDAFHLHNYLYQSLLEAVSGIKCACLIVPVPCRVPPLPPPRPPPGKSLFSNFILLVKSSLVQFREVLKKNVSF